MKFYRIFSQAGRQGVWSRPIATLREAQALALALARERGLASLWEVPRFGASRLVLRYRGGRSPERSATRSPPRFPAARRLNDRTAASV